MMRKILGSLGLACAVLTSACGDDDGGNKTVDGAVATNDGAPDVDAAAACSGEMFDKYGLEAFLAVNNSIIEKAVAAPTESVGTSFQTLAGAGEKRVAEFTANLGNFLVMVYGGPSNYTGPTMEDAHEGLNITSEQYDYFIANVVVPALADNGVPTTDIENCFAPPVVDPAFKNSIINK